MVLQPFMNLLYSLSALLNRIRSQRGQTFVEYSLILALIAIVAVAGLTAFQLSMTSLYEKLRQVSDAMVRSLT
jgi:Flp pilus assembly pilin Flp